MRTTLKAEKGPRDEDNKLPAFLIFVVVVYSTMLIPPCLFPAPIDDTEWMEVLVLLQYLLPAVCMY